MPLRITATSGITRHVDSHPSFGKDEEKQCQGRAAGELACPQADTADSSTCHMTSGSSSAGLLARELLLFKNRPVGSTGQPGDGELRIVAGRSE